MLVNVLKKNTKSILCVIQLLNLDQIIQVLFDLQRYNDLENYVNDADDFQEEKMD